MWFAPTFYSLLTSSFWSPPEVIRIVSSFGVTAADLPQGTLPNIIELVEANPQRWWFFKKGFHMFFKSLVRKQSISVRYRTKVTHLTFLPSPRKWKLRTARRNFLFDKVIVTTPPSATVPFLFESAQKDLIQSAVSRAPPIDVFISRISGYKRTGLNDQEAIWPDGFGLGTRGLINPALGGTVKPFFWQKRHDRNIIVIGTYTLSPDISTATALQVCKEFASNELGFEMGRVFATERYFYPSTPMNRSTWIQGWQTLQGENGLYFFGEAFAGSGVPAITEAAARFIANYFPPKP